MLIAVGVNHSCATVSDREALVAAPEELAGVVGGYAALGGADELVIVSTCYRVEIFAATRCPAAAAMALRQAFHERAGALELRLFEFHGDEALRHLTRVAAGLESAVLGEPQILGQVKEAFARAVEAGSAGPELGVAFRRAFQAAKRVRTETAIGRAGVSWGAAAGTLAEKVLGPLAGRRALVLGAGEMARLAGQHLREAGARIVVLNRSLAHAKALAADLGGEALPLELLGDELLRADMAISAAPVAPPAFRPEAMATVMRARPGRRLVLVDLAVPRAVPSETGALEGVYLCDVDDLARLAQASFAERSTAAAEAERVIEEELSRFARQDAERRAVPIIQAMRDQAEAIAREEVARTLRRLGEDPELETRLSAMAGAIVAKLLHAPSARLRRAGVDGEVGEALLAAARRIFDVQSEVGASRPAP